MSQSDQDAKIKVKGHVLVKDKLTDEILLDKHNAIHNKNMAIAIARGLANEAPLIPGEPSTHQVFWIKFGNGGSFINSMSEITYQPPNIIGDSASLYNETYSEVVDEQQVSTPTENSVTYQINPTDESVIVIVSAVIAAGEPVGQDLTDSPPNPDPEAQYAFDELGLFTYDNKLLTHIIFSPILKTANRELVITYTLTVTVS